MKNKLKCYHVKKINNRELKITGKADNILWDEAKVLNDFNSPWNKEKVKKITFKALWDTENFFFCFIIEDSEVYIDTTDDTISSINNSDRVEVFFRTNVLLDPYYCLEIDPTPRIMNFKARPNKQFDFNWNWPNKDISIKSHIQKEFFTVEGSISLDSLRAFNLLNNNKIEAGIYRAKFKQKQDGSYDPTWITWINPNTENPNFHVQSSFGTLKLINN